MSNIDTGNIEEALAKRLEENRERKEKKNKYQPCRYDGDCFGRTKDNECDILSDTKFRSGTCPFQKPKRYFTNGIYYPLDRHRKGGADGAH